MFCVLVRQMLQVLEDVYTVSYGFKVDSLCMIIEQNLPCLLSGFAKRHLHLQRIFPKIII